MGGPSSEHEVSLKSAAQVAAYLNRDKYEVGQVLIDKRGRWPVSPQELSRHADVAFIAMHGEFGEDGTVQRILEDAGLCYTGSDSRASALGMNKFLSLRLFRDGLLKVPDSWLIHLKEWTRSPRTILEKIKTRLGFPLVVKPNSAGSSVGVAIIKEARDLEKSFNESFGSASEILLQPYIRGREVTGGVLDYGTPSSAFALMPTEIIPQAGDFFDFASKYERGGALEITPPDLPETFIRNIQRTALLAHRLVGARGFSRTDMIFAPDGQLFVLEINTIPGFTERSLVPQAARAGGLTFDSLLDGIILAALHAHPEPLWRREKLAVWAKS